MHQNRNMRAAPSLTVGYTGNARMNRSKSQKWAALTLTAVQGVQGCNTVMTCIDSEPIVLRCSWYLCEHDGG